MEGQDISALDRVINEYASTSRDWGILTCWDKIKKAYSEQFPALQEKLNEMETELKQLAEPPFQYAIYLGPSLNSHDAIISAGRTRYEVNFASELKALHQHIVPGHQVILNKEMNIVDVRGNGYSYGETAEVINVIRGDREVEVVDVLDREPNEPLRLHVLRREDEEYEVVCDEELARLPVQKGWTVEINAAGDGASKARPRLHVKSSGNEGMVVEISDQLAQQGVQIGDIVCLDIGSKFAFEKLPPYEVGKLMLEYVPDVTYEDIGGLEDQIEQIYDAIDLPYLYRKEFERFQLTRPKGILLYGPPGCGKTMIAKAVANSLSNNIRNYLRNLKTYISLYQQVARLSVTEEWREQYVRLISDGEHDSLETARSRLAETLEGYGVDLARLDAKLREITEVIDDESRFHSFFLNIKGPELLDKYVGETEHRIRKVFEEARRYARSYYTPVVIFFDEMDAMFRTRGTGRSSDIETTIVPQFLSEIDGVESTENIILIGASNRQDMIDPAILRPGRLDVKIRVDRPTRKAAQDILTLYLLPTLPLNAEGIEVSKTDFGGGQVVFRNAYRRLAQNGTNTDEATALLPAGCDFRLARSLSEKELNVLAQFQHLTIRDTIMRWKEANLDWHKLLPFRPDSKVRDVLKLLLALEQQYATDVHIRDEVEKHIDQERIAEALIIRVVDLLYSPACTMSVLTNADMHYSFHLKDFLSGALLSNIVARAKRHAIKGYLIEQRTTKPGISFKHLRDAIIEEFEENKEQLAQHKIHNEFNRMHEEVQAVQVNLKSEEIDPWSEERPSLHLEIPSVL